MKTLPPVAWILSRQQYQRLTENAEVLARGGRTIKVLRRAEGGLVKLFWMKRRFSSDWFYPYSLRFKRNARRLIAKGVPCVQVTGTHFVPAERLHIAIYEPLPGQTLFELSGDGYLVPLGKFVAMLHHQGIYFRSLHLGNVVRMADGSYGLIDVADLRFRRRPLTPGERVRNLLHLIRRDDNRDRFGWAGLLLLLEAYLDAAEALGDGNDGLNGKLEQFKRLARAQFS